MPGVPAILRMKACNALRWSRYIRVLVAQPEKPIATKRASLVLKVSTFRRLFAFESKKPFGQALLVDYGCGSEMSMSGRGILL